MSGFPRWTESRVASRAEPSRPRSRRSWRTRARSNGCDGPPPPSPGDGGGWRPIPFDDWREAIAGAYRERLVLVRFVHRMRTVVANAAFRRWREFLVDGATTRAIERRAEIMAGGGRKSRCLPLSPDAAAARVDVRRALARHVRKWRRVDISYPFITWRDNVAENRRMKGSMERARRFGERC